MLRPHTFCENYSQLFGYLFVGHAGHLLLFQIDSTADGCQLSGNTFEDSRFAGTVRTYECKDFPFVQLDIDLSD